MATPARQPTISQETPSQVVSTTATLAAQIDPGGVPTTYHVEYVTEAQFAAPGFAAVPDVPISGFELTLPEGPYSLCWARTGICVPQSC